MGYESQTAETARLDELYHESFLYGRQGESLESFYELCEELNASEEEIANARCYYEDGVELY
jgi:hypothetical protein